jgi:hypothetical protein
MSGWSRLGRNVPEADLRIIFEKTLRMRRNRYSEYQLVSWRVAAAL